MPNEKFITGYTFQDLEILTFEKLNWAVNLAEATPYLINSQTPLGTSPADIDEILINDAPSAGASGVLRKITVAQLFGTGYPVTNLSSITGKTDTDFNLILSADRKFIVNRDFTVQEDAVINGTLTVNGKTTINNELEINGYVKNVSTSAMLIPVGTTAQRPQTPVVGQFRFNTTTQQAEVYKGSTWEAVGGGPFDATGGNIVIAPDAVATPAISGNLSSTDGVNVTVTASTSNLFVGQIVSITTSVAGYSGEYQVKAVTATNFTYTMNVVAVPNSGACTYKKAGKYKIHIFTSSGTFTTGDKAGVATILAVGGGGGVQYWENYSIPANTTWTVTVGQGGAAAGWWGTAGNGTPSVIGPIVAQGGEGAWVPSGQPHKSGAAGPTNLKNVVGRGWYGTTTNAAGAGGGGWDRDGVGTSGSVGEPGAYVPFGNNTPCGMGGTGFGSTITGLPMFYAGGGAGSWFSPHGNQPGAAPVPNTGGGGGQTAAGSSGIVVVRYAYWV